MKRKPAKAVSIRGPVVTLTDAGDPRRARKAAEWFFEQLRKHQIEKSREEAA